MVTGLSIVFLNFFYFFSCAFVGVTALRFIDPLLNMRVMIYITGTLVIYHYVTYIFVYTYTISDGNTFVNTFYKKNMFFFKHNMQ